MAGGSDRGGSVTRGGGGATELPSQFGRYRVKKKLGGGGMGSVYLVENTELEREEALKVPHFEDGAETEVRERFLREARSAAKLDHANLCPIYDAGVQDGIYYLTMRFLNGKLLSDFIGTALPIRKAVGTVAKLAQALEAAHTKGVIHRDLKPSNIMMVADVGPVVMDFGLAKQVRQVDQKLTQAGSMLGTPAYMPPEQVNGDLERMGPASDVYSLGVILFELLTSRLPFEGTMASVFGKILYTGAPLPSAVAPGLDPALDGICLKALAKEPAERYPSMKAFAAALSEYLRSTPVLDGAGSLLPGTRDKAAAFQAPTVMPGARAAGQADIFLAQTVMPQARSSPPALPIGRNTPLPGGSLQTVVAAGHADFVEDGTRGGASFGTNPARMFVVTGVLGALAAVGWLTYPMTKTTSQESGKVAEVTPPKNPGLPKASSAPSPPPAPLADNRPNSSPPPSSRRPPQSTPNKAGPPRTRRPGLAESDGEQTNNGARATTPNNGGAPRTRRPDLAKSVGEQTNNGARVNAGAAAQIGDLVVGVSAAQIGTSSQYAGKETLTLTLRITNLAANPMTYINGWPDPKVTLRDQNGNYYNRLASPKESETQIINPDVTTTDTIEFEAPPMRVRLELQLPIGDKKYEFLIPPIFIQRPPPIAGAPRRKEQPKAAPAPAQPFDPEHDPKVRSSVTLAYSMRMNEIKKRSLGMNTNNSNNFKKDQRTKLIKKLADESKLGVEQIERIIFEEQMKAQQRKKR